MQERDVLGSSRHMDGDYAALLAKHEELKAELAEQREVRYQRDLGGSLETHELILNHLVGYRRSPRGSYGVPQGNESPI